MRGSELKGRRDVTERQLIFEPFGPRIRQYIDRLRVPIETEARDW
jgi:hypothetical protein